MSATVPPMPVMILAAGRGERMRPLTDHCPKPLLPVGGKPLLVWHLERLSAAGFDRVVINHAHLGEHIVALLGDGSAWGVNITYSAEPPGALETAGGIVHALPCLGEGPFLVINGDIWCDWPPARARDALKAGDWAHLILVPNPPHHQQGDFFCADGRVSDTAPASAQRHTFAGIGVYHPRLFADLQPGCRASLAPVLRAAMRTGQVSGDIYQGRWDDVGTPQRLQALDHYLLGQTTPPSFRGEMHP
jgi:MurNAc alpha-1-phosphate uridylyltransferase